MGSLKGKAAIVTGARHPRGNTSWPRVGIFAQRGKARPNRLGATIVQIEGREGRTLRVRGLDAVDGTPVVDIKPVFTEFMPRGPVRQPAWSHERPDSSLGKNCDGRRYADRDDVCATAPACHAAL